MNCDYYLDITQDEFGTMFDYAINDCKINIDKFQELFINSSIADRLEKNDFLLISGKSGVELVNEFIPKSKQTKPSYPIYTRSKEYWTGFVFAYYWMKSIYTMKEIVNTISLNNIRIMYHPYHEMDIQKIYDEIDRLMYANKIQKLRIKTHMSQSQLSTLSNIPLKTIQKYESNERDIRKASVDILLRISRTLNCSIEELILK